MLRNNISLIIASFLLAFTPINCLSQTFQFTDKVVANDRNNYGSIFFGHAVSIEKYQTLIGTKSSAYFFVYDSLGQWKQTQKITPSGPRTAFPGSDWFGSFLELDSHQAIIGAFRHDFNQQGLIPIYEAGAAFIFEKNGLGVWTETQKLVAFDRDTLDSFGFSVSISGNYAVVGAPKQKTNSNSNSPLTNAGAVYIFKRGISGAWAYSQKLTPSDREAYDSFGHSVKLVGEKLLVGAPFKTKNISPSNFLLASGAVYLYSLSSNGLWTQTQKILPTDIADSDNFGWSIDLDSNVAVIGARTKSNGIFGAAGAAYIFNLNSSGGFNQTAKLLAPDAGQGDEFGSSTAISGDKVIIGASYEDEDSFGNNTLLGSGSVYVFSKDSLGSWQNAQKLTAPARTGGDWFGSSVDIIDEIVVIGAHTEDEDSLELNTINQSGSAYYFQLCETVSSNLDVIECKSFLSPSKRSVWTKSGIYVDSLKTTFGCDSLIHINLTIHADSNPIHLNSVKQNVSCHNNSDGQISANVIGGISPYNFHWNTGDTLPSLSNLSAGIYTVTVTDSLGCSISDSFEIKEPNDLQITMVSYRNVTCYGDENGELNPQAVGGTPPYLYSWSTGKQTQSIKNLKSGTYNLTITDSNGCSTSEDFVISQPDSLHIKSSELLEANCRKPTGHIKLQIAGGIEPYSIGWSNGQTGETIKGVYGGSYSVFVSDSNGCTTEATYRLKDNIQDTVYFANAFTPNGDGINDKYILHGNPDCYSNVKFQIFNRWGEKLFETNRPFEKFWNGSVDGFKPKQDVYVYIFISDEFNKSGYVQVLQ